MTNERRLIMKSTLKFVIRLMLLGCLILICLKNSWILTIVIVFVVLPSLVIGIVKLNPEFWKKQLDATKSSGVACDRDYYPEEQRREDSIREAEIQKEYKRKAKARMRYNEAITRQYNARTGSETEKAIADAEVKRRFGDLV